MMVLWLGAGPVDEAAGDLQECARARAPGGARARLTGRLVVEAQFIIQKMQFLGSQNGRKAGKKREMLSNSLDLVGVFGVYNAIHLHMHSKTNQQKGAP